MINQATTRQLSSRIEKLIPRIRFAAGHVFATQPVSELVDFDDIMQAMMLRIVERANQKPDLLDQTDAFIMIDATRNAGYRVCRSETNYLSHVAPESIINNDEDERISIIDMAVASDPNPEDQLLENEFAENLKTIIKGMSPRLKELLSLSISGLSDSEIAIRLRVTKSAISQRRNQIQKQLSLICQ